MPLFDSHMHTPLCGHAIGSPDEYAEKAWERGLDGIVFTCHAPLPEEWRGHTRMTLGGYPDYLEWIRTTRRKWLGRLYIGIGLEVDYLPGLEPFIRKLLQIEKLDYVLGSVHPLIPEYQEEYGAADAFDAQQLYFDLLARAAESRLFNALAHPDLIKCQTAETWNVDLLLPAMDACLDRIAATGTALELNTSGLLKPLREFLPGRRMLERMRRRSIPVVPGSDSHEPSRVGADFPAAFEELAAAGYDSISFYIKGARGEMRIEDAAKRLQARI